MGAVASKITRKINRFNVENRAHRFLEQDKAASAPKYESNLRDMQRTLEIEPDFIEKLNKKDSALDNRLKNVYVTSEDIFFDRNISRIENPDRPLPQVRSQPEDFEYGYLEPKHVRIGRCTLRQAMKFIMDHNESPADWPKERIADEYNLKVQNVENLLFYFKPFGLHLPDTHLNEKLLEEHNRMLEAKKDKK